jgi:hypothetical protein
LTADRPKIEADVQEGPGRLYLPGSVIDSTAPTASRQGCPAAKVQVPPPAGGGPASIRPGYDAGKKIKGKKRHILVDTLGLLLHAIVHPADIQDRDGGILVMATLF